MKQVLFFLSIAFLMASCNQMNRYEIIGEAQGTYYRILYYHDSELISLNETDSILDAFDLSASNYAPNSIISKVNRNEDMQVDETFEHIFMLAERISHETNGIFDITVRPLVELYGFGKSDQVLITDAKRDSIMAFVGYQKVHVVNGMVTKEDPRLQLDFNAIAQGYSVDHMLDFLVQKGIKIALVDIGGEVRSLGVKPDGKQWTVGIEVPNESASYGQEIQSRVYLGSKAMATSGNYRKFIEKDGKKYVHTLNPATGEGVQSSLLSASVVANTAAEADAYATACMVMGLEKSIEFIEANSNLDCYLIYANENGEFEYFVSEGMKQMLPED
jgi:thiamine biosynthesis lipoprotein